MARNQATVAATNGGGQDSGTSHTVNLPSGSAKRVLVRFTAATPIANITFPGGWTVSASGNYSGGNYGFVEAYKDFSGTIDSTITVTTSGSTNSSHSSFAFANADLQTAPAAAYADAGNVSNPNAASLNPSWGSEPTLWLVGTPHRNDELTSVTYPTNYTEVRHDQPGAIGNFGNGIATGERALEADSEDPGAFTLSAAVFCGVVFTAIRGSEPGATGGVPSAGLSLGLSLGI